MAGFSRNITLTYGMLQVAVKLTTTAVPNQDEKLVQLCTGSGQHDPTKPNWDPFCPECGTQVGRDTLSKGSEVAKDTFVVFGADEIAALKDEDDQFKGAITLSAHDAVEVEGQVMQSGTTYYVTPQKNDKMYPLLQMQVAENPDLAFMGVYTVTSRAALYRLRTYGEVLVLEQLLWPEDVAAAPEVPHTDVPEAMVETVREVARKFVTPFDATTFRNTYRDRLNAAVSDREASAGTGVAPTPIAKSAGPTASDPMADMLAAMSAMVGDQPTAPATSAPKRARKPKAKSA